MRGMITILGRFWLALGKQLAIVLIHIGFETKISLDPSPSDSSS